MNPLPALDGENLDRVLEGEDGEVVASNEELAREALKKIPSQVEKWKWLIDKNRFQLPVPLQASYFASVFLLDPFSRPLA